MSAPPRAMPLSGNRWASPILSGCGTATALRAVVGEVVRGRMDKKAGRRSRRAHGRRSTSASAERERFREIAESELLGLHEGNFARYQIRPSEFAAWRGGMEQVRGPATLIDNVAARSAGSNPCLASEFGQSQRSPERVVTADRSGSRCDLCTRKAVISQLHSCRKQPRARGVLRSAASPMLPRLPRWGRGSKKRSRGTVLSISFS